MNDEVQKTAKSWKGLTVVILLLIICLTIYNLYSGNIVKKLNFIGLEVEFAERTQGIVTEKRVEEVGAGELKTRQVNLEGQLKELQARLEEKGEQPATLVANSKTSPARVNETTAPAFNLTGTWEPLEEDPSTYSLWQNGDSLVLEQSLAPYGVLAVGQGQIVGRSINITYTTALGTTGRGTATISPDGNRITGEVTDLTTGVTSPLIISR
jgi:hypothetical protein